MKKTRRKINKDVSIFDKGYGWLKEKILNEEGRKQQGKVRELSALASRLDCTLAQLAIGE